jgi:hypothetical protein
MSVQFIICSSLKPVIRYYTLLMKTYSYANNIFFMKYNMTVLQIKIREYTFLNHVPYEPTAQKGAQQRPLTV